MQALVDACFAGDVNAEPVLVLSNNIAAEGLKWANERGLAIAAIDHRAYDDRASFEKDVTETLETHEIEFIALAGFMRVLTEEFTEAWTGRMVNIHPSLLPKYKGLHTHKRALEAGDSEHGASVHWVSSGVDEGEVIEQVKLDIQPGDTEASLAERLLPLEHQLYPRALQQAIETFQRQSTD